MIDVYWMESLATIQEKALTQGADMSLYVAAFLAGGFGAIALQSFLTLLRFVSGSSLSVPALLGGAIMPHLKRRDRNSVGTLLHLVMGASLCVIFIGIVDTAFSEFSFGWLAIAFSSVLWLAYGLVLLPFMGVGVMGQKENTLFWAHLLFGFLLYGVVIGLLFPFLFIQP